MSNRRFFSTERGGTPYPKHTRTKKILGCGMIEHQSRFGSNLAHIKGILHQQKNVNVVGFGFGGNK